MNKVLVEKLAAYSHGAWAQWMKYFFTKVEIVSESNDEVLISIPADLHARWQYQMETEYKDLPEEMKPSDREEAKKIIDVVSNHSIDDKG